MSKSNKIIVIAISVTLALCVTVIAFSSATDTENEPSVTASESAYDETVPTAEPSADVNGTTAQQTPSWETPESSESLTSSSAPATSGAGGTVEATQSSQYLSTLIVGKWRDSAGMSGFEFFEDGKASITVFDMESIGIGDFDVTGTNGVYSIEGNVVTIKYSIYATIEKKYEVSIANDVLTMKDLDEGNVQTYTRQAPSVTGTTSAQTTSAAVSATSVPENTQAQTFALEGRFISGDKKNELTFNSDGTVEVKIKRDDFSGVYQIVGNKLTIVYIDGGKSISEEYDYTLNGTILTLTSSKGEASVYVKQ